MYNYKYVVKDDWQPIKNELIEIIHEVQNLVRDHFTFQYTFVGSSSRNMITCDYSQNKGYDFDVNININDDEEYYNAKEIRELLLNAFNKVVLDYGYDYAENSTKVITIKVKDFENSKILHSCDFCIVNDFVDNNGNECQQYIRYNKNNNSYSWCKSPMPMWEVNEKADELKRQNYWNIVRDEYLENKNKNTNKDKKSISIYKETINNCYAKYI